jgi:hypothetical protein
MEGAPSLEEIQYLVMLAGPVPPELADAAVWLESALAHGDVYYDVV